MYYMVSAAAATAEVDGSGSIGASASDLELVATGDAPPLDTAVLAAATPPRAEAVPATGAGGPDPDLVAPAAVDSKLEVGSVRKDGQPLKMEPKNVHSRYWHFARDLASTKGVEEAVQKEFAKVVANKAVALMGDTAKQPLWADVIKELSGNAEVTQVLGRSEDID